MSKEEIIRSVDQGTYYCILPDKRDLNYDKYFEKLKNLDIDLVQLGILSSVFYVVYGIGKFISGLFADRANIRMFMAIGLFLASIIHLFIGFLDSLFLIVFFWGLTPELISRSRARQHLHRHFYSAAQAPQ